MSDTEGLDRLLFELASESRLGILRELEAGNRKMQEVARRQDLTSTDAFRQLQRLSDALLIQRQPDGAYTITPYGRLVLRSTMSLAFLEKHKSYFLAHDLQCLPGQFVDRIGELSGAMLCTDSMENINKATRMMAEAGQYFWGGGPERPLENAGRIAYERASKGIGFRFLFPEPYIPDRKALSETPKNIEWRSLSDIPVTIVLTDKEAGICFPIIGGKADYVSFIGNDPAFLGWVKDLFLHYWEKGTRT